MPSADAILTHLTLATNGAAALAIGWHLVGAIAVAALLLGWRPSKWAAGVLLTAPITSAAAVAFFFGNPFNGVVLTALSSVLLVLTTRFEDGRVARGSAGATGAGILMIAFGAWYPHFLETRTIVAYLYAAPTGVVPCPTLAVVIGVALVANGLGGRVWALTLAAAGLFYGVFGAVRLGVRLDLALVAGAVALLLATLFRAPHTRRSAANAADGAALDRPAQ
jgi:hypothetical protein